jgi:hypothetical protein
MPHHRRQADGQLVFNTKTGVVSLRSLAFSLQLSYCASNELCLQLRLYFLISFSIGFSGSVPAIANEFQSHAEQSAHPQPYDMALHMTRWHDANPQE